MLMCLTDFMICIIMKNTDNSNVCTYGTAQKQRRTRTIVTGRYSLERYSLLYVHALG